MRLFAGIGLLWRGRGRRMGREILCQAGVEFVCGALNIAVEGGDHGGDVFAADGLVVIIEMGPDGIAGFGVAHLQFESEARGHRRAGDFLEIIKMTVKEIIAAHTAAKRIYGAVSS